MQIGDLFHCERCIDGKIYIVNFREDMYVVVCVCGHYTQISVMGRKDTQIIKVVYDK